jgi:N-dimethylarginine dimethylaminohydrolase
VPNLLDVAQVEAERFACNAVVIGKRVITNIGCEELHAMIRAAGYEPFATPLDEFAKAGGSAKCLTLRLDGEEAATWKR